MKDRTVRLTGITIENFKNVISGSLLFENSRRNYKSSILGLYGQNGSGKTALIDVIELLKYALCGKPVPQRFADYINVDYESAAITYEFNIELPGGSNHLSYQICINRANNDDEKGARPGGSNSVYISSELIKCPILTDKQIKLGRLIDTGNEDIFGPRPKRQLLLGNEKGALTNLIVAKKMAEKESRSYVFSREMIETIRDRSNAGLENSDAQEQLKYYFSLIDSLVYYGNNELFVINTSNSGLISLNAQPLTFKYMEKELRTSGTIMIPLDAPVVVPKIQKNIVEKIIGSMNTVLEQIIPGLTIQIRDLGTEIMDNGEVGNRIQLVSCRNGKEIALKYESEGIKKIVSILQLLTVVYNQSSITVAIDELDAGVFEYLLGEILRIISEKGKGQLIFTSHNLRPLETLDRGFLAFTTINPNNRYIRMTNIKDNNNLRDVYYRDIMLGEKNEELYEPTNNAEIAFAFREAGEYSGS